MNAVIEMAATHETGVTGQGGLRYNIQMARASDGVWFQRHVWHEDQLGKHNPPRCEEWIKSFSSGPGAHMRRLSQ